MAGSGAASLIWSKSGTEVDCFAIYVNLSIPTAGSGFGGGKTVLIGGGKRVTSGQVADDDAGLRFEWGK